VPNRLITRKEWFYGEQLAQALLDFAVATLEPEFILEALVNQRDSRIKMKDFEPTEDTISLYGLGFIQIKLGGNQRLHVWHPDLPRRRCFEHSAIHDHRFSFVSRVLVGTQINHAVDLMGPGEFRDPTHIAYLHEGPRGAHGGRPWVEDFRCAIHETGIEVMEAGDLYNVPAYCYHWTEPGGDGRVATLMTKTWEGNKGAHSVCKRGVEPDVAFDRKCLPSARLWLYVTEVLGSAK
jgi:hypothetical protein